MSGYQTLALSIAFSERLQSNSYRKFSFTELYSSWHAVSIDYDWIGSCPLHQRGIFSVSHSHGEHLSLVKNRFSFCSRLISIIGKAFATWMLNCKWILWISYKNLKEKKVIYFYFPFCLVSSSVIGFIWHSVVVLQCIVSITFSLGTIAAANTMHTILLAAVLRLPMTFFDVTPLGRILNRFAKDVDVCDNVLPHVLRMFIAMTFAVSVPRSSSAWSNLVWSSRVKKSMKFERNFYLFRFYWTFPVCLHSFFLVQCLSIYLLFGGGACGALDNLHKSYFFSI